MEYLIWVAITFIAWGLIAFVALVWNAMFGAKLRSPPVTETPKCLVGNDWPQCQREAGRDISECLIAAAGYSDA